MASKRQLKNKIQAVGNIRQMTKAMELVAATKMRRAQETALQGRPYAVHALSLLFRLGRYLVGEQVKGSLWTKQKEGKVCLVVVTSDKGLCGSFNSAVLEKAWDWYEEKLGQGETIEIVAVGRKAKTFFEKRGAKVIAEFFRFSDVLTLPDAHALSQYLLTVYGRGEYKEVLFCSAVFVSAFSHIPFIHSIMPLSAKELAQIVQDIVPKTGKYAELRREGTLEAQPFPYVLEPALEDIMESLARDLVQVAVLHLLLESNASEHSARMIAMKNATDNAGELMDALTLQLNKARQSAITQELTEISTAKEALTYE